LEPSDDREAISCWLLTIGFSVKKSIILILKNCC